MEAHESVVLVGHSMGAILALALAARYPQKVSQLVLVSLPCFHGDLGAVRSWFRRRPGGWIYTNLMAMALACVVTRYVAVHLLPLIFREYPRAVVEDLVKHNVMSSTTSLWNVVYKYDIAPDAGSLPAALPVTCIHSEDDDMSSIETIRSITETFRWRLVVLGDAGHHPWLRYPERCFSIVAGEQEPPPF